MSKHLVTAIERTTRVKDVKRLYLSHKLLHMKRKNEGFLLLLVLLRIIIPYLLQNGMYEPHRDEFLYLAEGNHPAAGFMEVPPLLSWFAWLTHQLGDGMFWIKLWPSLFGAATLYVMGRLVLLLGGGRFALLLLFLSFVFNVYLRVFFLFQPNPPEIFFWTMIVFSTIRYVQTNKSGWLYLFGVCVGFGMLSKYSVLFYTVSVLCGFLLTRHRSVFGKMHFWLACGVGFVIFLPNLYWQYTHHFPVVYHMNELRETQLQYISPMQFLAGQILMFLPCFFIWLCGLYNVLFSRSNKLYRFVGFAYIFVILILLAGHGKNYYALGAYPVLLAFGSYHLEKFTAVKRKALRYALVIVPIIIGIWFLPMGLPIAAPGKLAGLYKRWGLDKTGALKWEDLAEHPLPQDFADMLGWEEMTKKVAAAYHSLTPEEKKNAVIFCNNYGMAGAVNFYGKKYKLPEAYSDNASFLYWIPDSIKMQNLILVCTDSDELQQPYVKNFREVYFSDSVTNPFAREYGDYIAVEKGANDSFQIFFREKLQKDKEKLEGKK